MNIRDIFDEYCQEYDAYKDKQPVFRFAENTTRDLDERFNAQFYPMDNGIGYYKCGTEYMIALEDAVLHYRKLQLLNLLRYVYNVDPQVLNMITNSDLANMTKVEVDELYRRYMPCSPYWILGDFVTRDYKMIHDATNPISRPLARHLDPNPMVRKAAMLFNTATKKFTPCAINAKEKEWEEAQKKKNAALGR